MALSEDLQLSDLPDDLILYIAGFLPKPVDKFRFGNTCKRFKCCDTAFSVWKDIDTLKLEYILEKGGQVF